MILISSIQEKSYKDVNVCIKYFSTASNVADEGEEDKSDDEGQEQVVDSHYTQTVNEMEDFQSSVSASSNRVTTPPSLTPCRRPTPGKRIYYCPNNRDPIEEKLLKITLKPEKQPDEGEIFCLSLATSLRKIQDPQRKEYMMLQLQQTMYNCMYGS